MKQMQCVIILAYILSNFFIILLLLFFDRGAVAERLVMEMCTLNSLCLTKTLQHILVSEAKL